MGSLDSSGGPPVVPLPSPQEPIIYINGKRKVLPDGYAETTLLEYLREIGLTGTKLGCGEGGCGACTVMVSHFDNSINKIVHRSVNACLAPLYSMEGMHVITVEGIGNRRDGLHPVQERLSTAHGSQCGFCTPGFIMSMYTLLRSSPTPPTEEQIEENLAGNLCRCTGYRPILDAFRVFAKTDAGAYTEDATTAAGVSPVSSGGTASGPGICPSTGRPCDCGVSQSSDGTPAVFSAAADSTGAPEEQVSKVTPGSKPCPAGCLGGCQAHGVNVEKVLKGKTWNTSAEPIFPAELRSRQVGTLTLKGSHGSMWYRPTTLEQLLSLKAMHPSAKLLVGNSEVGIEMKLKGLRYPVLIGTTAVPELSRITAGEKGLEIGSAVTLTNMMEAMRTAIKERAVHETRTCVAVVEQLRWFAGNQIRNVASLGGNICTASPISDLNPIWMATGTTFTVLAATGASRTVSARNFFIGYRKVDLKEDEILASVFVPWTREHEYVKEYKQAHRRDDDIAIVNACIRVQLAPSSDGAWTAAEVGIAYGGVAALSVSAAKTEAFLCGKSWTQEVLKQALEVLAQDIAIPDGAPGGMPEFRRSLTASFLFKFFLHVAFELEKDANVVHGLPDTWRSAVAPYERPTSQGLQYFETKDEGNLVGLPLPHMSADMQVTGEAEYVDDIPMPATALHAALVLSSKPHARLKTVDASPAKSSPGYVGFYCAKDVPGRNDFGSVVHDEEVFASEFVTCVGQIIGIVIATSHESARIAARKVRIEYEELPALFSIEDAIEANSFHPIPEATDKLEYAMNAGDVDSSLAGGECDHILEGSVQIGGQEQFYLESNSTLVWTLDGGSEVHMISSTQAPTHHQKDVARVLGLPLHKVVCKVKRIGGGFGGKETRSVIVAAAAAVPAWHLKRPIKCTLDRDVDMSITGQRHPFLGKYKVGFTKEGKLRALDLKIYNNGGNSLDLSHSVLGRAMFHSDNVYAIPNVRIRGRIAKTNLPSNTAFRGFGAPQGMLIAENIIERIAANLDRPVEEIRLLNMQGEGYKLHYGQTLSNCHLARLVSELRASSEFDARRAAVDEFNRQNRWKKRGLALLPTKYGISFVTKFLNQGGALVHIYTDGTVLVTHGGVEMGQGLHTKVAQVAAAELGVPLSSVFIAETSTDKVPNTSPTASSTSSDIYGAATRNACIELKKRMKPMAEANPGMPFQKIVEKCYFDRIDLSAHGFYITPGLGFDWATGKGEPFAYYTQGAAASEAEIDTLTGDFQLLRTDIIMDLGTSINPAIDIGQIEGAFVQGLGWAVTEELKWGDRAHPWIRPGHLFTAGPGAYKIPAVNDIPIDFRVSLLSGVGNPAALLSSKAVGEPPLFLASSAMFAIKDAIYAARKDHGQHSWFPLDTPATPERIRLACSDEFTVPMAPEARPKLSV